MPSIWVKAKAATCLPWTSWMRALPRGTPKGVVTVPRTMMALAGRVRRAAATRVRRGSVALRWCGLGMLRL